MQPRQPIRPSGQRPQPRPAPNVPPGQAPQVDTRNLFRTAQQKISATREDGTSKFVSAEVKQRWLDNLTPLYLHKLVYRQSGKFGPQWTLHLSEEDPGNPVYFASFKANDYRDTLFPELQTAIESSGQPLGPLMLTVHQVEGQVNPSWDIQPWDDGAGVPF